MVFDPKDEMQAVLERIHHSDGYGGLVVPGPSLGCRKAVGRVGRGRLDHSREPGVA